MYVNSQCSNTNTFIERLRVSTLYQHNILKQVVIIDDIIYPFRHTRTAWKVSKIGVFSGPYFPVFGPNTEIYFVFSPNTGKYGPEKPPYLDTFHAVILIWSLHHILISQVYIWDWLIRFFLFIIQFLLSFNNLIAFWNST